jgi:hypothetical protein
VAALADTNTAAIYYENPAYLGGLETGAAELAAIAARVGAETIAGVDPISLGVIAPPGELGVDIAVGTIQTLGVHMHAGGGLGGFIATRDDARYAAEYPTLLNSLTTTVDGQLAFGLMLFHQSSYGSRELGKDWTGNSTYLWAVAAATYMALLGPAGFAEIGHLISQLDRGQIPHPAARGAVGSNMYQAMQKRPSRQDTRSARNRTPVRQFNARKPTGIKRQARHLTLNHRQVLFFGKKLLDRFTVQLAISLRARPLNSRPLSPVQQSELNPSAICSARHNAIKGVYLTHEVPLSQTPNRRITGHHADTRPTQRDQRSRRAHAGGCRSRFRAGMPAPNDDDIKMFHVKHPHFPIQNREKISSSRSSTPTLPIIISSDTEAA